MKTQFADDFGAGCFGVLLVAVATPVVIAIMVLVL